MRAEYLLCHLILQTMTTQGEEVKQRRAFKRVTDELEEVQTKYDQLSEKVNTLIAQREEDQALINELVDDVDHLLERNVAYHVRLSGSMTLSYEGQIIKFGDVTLNKGNAYDASTGIFTAPTSGVYFFYATLMHYFSGELAFYLKVNGIYKLAMGHTGFDNNLASGTITAMVWLEEGDYVYFSNAEVGAANAMYGGTYTSYGGFKYM